MKQFYSKITCFAIALMVSGFTTVTTAFASDPPVTGLNGWTIFLDAGHAQTENMGLYNYSEAQKVLRVALYLRDMLEQQTDIQEVFMARTTDAEQIGLTARINYANSLGADFYYSIHSDAGGPTANSTLMLWGGWRSGGQSIEKTPNGGKKMGDLMDTDLTASMRIPRRGGYYDRVFYQGNVNTHSNQFPYLAVNRISVMPSVLSEAGFHTNPTQQMRNLNAEWKKLEAQSAFWSILAYHELPRPDVGIVTGFIRNQENQELLNGATIQIGEKTYTTDTFESLFNQYSSNPDLLRNGFYYIEDLEPNSQVDVIVSAPGFYSDTIQTTVNPQFFTFVDVSLVSTVPPFVVATNPADGSSQYDPVMGPVEIEFSRPIQAASIEDQITISPELNFSYQLVNQRFLRITIDSLEFLQDISVTLGEDIEDLYSHKFDGNKDGASGGTYTLDFRVRSEDITPPQVVSTFPTESQTKVNRNSYVSFIFDEGVDPESITSETIKITKVSDDSEVAVNIHHYTIDNRSVIQAYPVEPFESNTEYYGWLMPGVADIYGNVRENISIIPFETESYLYTYQTIDNFNGGVTNWWQTTASGSNLGIVGGETLNGPESEITNPKTGSTGAFFLQYGWEPGAGAYLTRNYLPPGASQNNARFTTENILEAYVFGDNSGNRIRFMARDGSNQLEGSPWYTIDWIGWKLIRWDLATTPPVAWVNGDGKLDGSSYTDSFQMTHVNGAATLGRVVVDDYRIATKIPGTSIQEPGTAIPNRVMLSQNYPNPFNPTTTISFALPETMSATLEVYDLLGRRVATLANGDFAAGNHTVTFDASQMSSGVYIYRLSTQAGVQTGKMMLVK
jgi:N-acetylmuramoyl-L-alanine amidase